MYKQCVQSRMRFSRKLFCQVKGDCSIPFNKVFCCGNDKDDFCGRVVFHEVYCKFSLFPDMLKGIVEQKCPEFSSLGNVNSVIGGKFFRCGIPFPVFPYVNSSATLQCKRQFSPSAAYVKDCP